MLTVGPPPLREAEQNSSEQTLEPDSLDSVSVLELSSLVTLDKLHNFSVPRFSPL